jgi:hypothetical protein
MDRDTLTTIQESVTLARENITKLADLRFVSGVSDLEQGKSGLAFRVDDSKAGYVDSIIDLFADLTTVLAGWTSPTRTVLANLILKPWFKRVHQLHLDVMIRTSSTRNTARHGSWTRPNSPPSSM